ncbi:NAD(P)/FAD-dependent oxidoreductase [Plantibacter sp. CFBP 8798]|uniref:dihydrolipoyl dehydrogenase family protein n=1 Tax=Plantibacter sp. CFBP 8798 TaxID=2775268 RepID=UPI00177D5624|nr:NAD(P)/FAD-dependent oxidoreductase [Plantibacter sp. CFBP 8798]MBD8468305.1 NAD(P)/FAD-dependent oxidoreductase [Plantibacter sp. CFBP 8798]
MSRTVDLVVIGAGPVGENVADYAHKSGLSVVIVESELVGGECSYWACMPSKALIRSGAALRAAKRTGGAIPEDTALDPLKVLARRDSFTSDWSDDGQVEWLQGAGIELVRGHGRLTGEREVTVTAADGSTTVLTATHAVAVCTGSAALLPDIAGLAAVEPWTSREATSVQTLPASVAFLGGGVVAVELATAYRSLGVDVTLVARSGLLGNTEPFAGELVESSLRELGVTIVHASPTAVSRAADGAVTLEFDGRDAVTTAELVVATGRTPRTDDLGLETVGLEPGAWIEVDDQLLAHGSDWLYAVGDVNHRALLTHQGKYQARAAGAVIAARANGEDVDTSPWSDHAATADHRAVPQVVFSEPEVAAVGLTAAQAEAAGIDHRVVDYDLGGIAGSSLHADGYTGQARMVVDEERGVIIGMTFVGQDVAELVHAATIAVVGEVPLHRLWHAVPSYPTMSEIWLRLLETYRSGA